jgi:tetratricopeptide (TPR) repeat protein
LREGAAMRVAASNIPLAAAIVAIAVGFASPPANAETPPADAERWQQLMYKSAQALKSNDVAKAERQCIEARDLASNFAAPDTRLSRSQMQLAEIYRWKKQNELAEQTFKEAVASCERAIGPEHPDMVDPLESLANFYMWTVVRPQEVESLYRRILTIVEHVPNHDDGEIARRARNLADAEARLGHAFEAESLYQRALALMDKNEQELPYYLLATADFYAQVGKFDQAEPLARRALAIREKRTGPDADLETATALLCIGDINFASKQLDQAEQFYNRALALAEKIAGVDSADLTPYLVGLGGALRAQGKADAAEAQYRRAIRVTEKGLGHDAPEVAAVLERYAALLDETARAPEAVAMRERIEAIRKTAAAQ